MLTDNRPEFLKVFDAEVSEAARCFYYYSELDSAISNLLGFKKPENFDGNANQIINYKMAYFFQYYIKMSLSTCYMALGRIFDTDKRSHRLDNTYNKLLEYGQKADWTELDYAALETYNDKLIEQWKEIKHIRHKLIAHKDLKPNLASVEQKQIERLIQNLWSLLICANNTYNNKHKPDFSAKISSIKNECSAEIQYFMEALISSE